MSTLRVNTVTDQAGTGQASAAQVGVGQTWQNLTASRAVNTDYTNSTGRPIAVGIAVQSNGLTSDVQLNVGGVTVQRFVFNLTSGTLFIGGSLFAVVPAGATYRLNQTAATTILHWAELRV